jgi:hypothetical protein
MTERRCQGQATGSAEGECPLGCWLLAAGALRGGVDRRTGAGQQRMPPFPVRWNMDTRTGTGTSSHKEGATKPQAGRAGKAGRAGRSSGDGPWQSQ